METLPKWAPLAIGGVVLFLVLRARAAGGGSPSPAHAVQSDVSRLQQQAQAIQLDQLGKQAAYQDALRGLTLKSQQQQAELFSQASQRELELLKVPFACPSGHAKLDPVSGQVYCRSNKGGGLTLGSLFGPTLNSLANTLPKLLNGYLGLPGGIKPGQSQPAGSGSGGTQQLPNYTPPALPGVIPA